MRLFRVSYHAGSMCALVKAETPERAVEIAKAHRETKRLWSGKPPQSVLSDNYEVEPASESDIAWCKSFRVGVLTGMPEKPRKRAARSRKQLAGAPGGVAATGHAGGQFCEAA